MIHCLILTGLHIGNLQYVTVFIFLCLPTFHNTVRTLADDSRLYHNKCHISWQKHSLFASEKINNSFSPPWTPVSDSPSSPTSSALYWPLTGVCHCGGACPWHVLESGILPAHELICLLAGGVKQALSKFSWYLWVTVLKETPDNLVRMKGSLSLLCT